MSQDAKDDALGGLSPLKPADAEVQKICDQVSASIWGSSLMIFLSPLNFEMPCLAIADNPRNPRLESMRNDRASSQNATFQSIYKDWFPMRKKDMESYLT